MATFPTDAVGIVHNSAGHHQRNTLAATVSTPRHLVFNGERTLTPGVATVVANITLPTGRYAGGMILATSHATNATPDFQACTETLLFSAVNKTGTPAAAIQTTAINSNTAASAGTLTCVWTAVANGASVDIKCAATSSLPTPTVKLSFQLFLNGDGASLIS